MNHVPSLFLLIPALAACHGIAIDPGKDSAPVDSRADSGESAAPPDSPTDTVPVQDTAPPDLPQCDPQLSMDTPYHLEGDLVELTFQCGSGASPSLFQARLSGAPADLVFDATAWTASWQTDLSDGARYDLVLAVTPLVALEEGWPAFPETVVATFWVADNVEDPANLHVDPETYTEEWGIPVLHISPRSTIGGSYVPADVTWMGASGTGEVQIRGAASASYPKPSYLLRTEEFPLDLGDFGMGTVDHLVLITSFDDNSYVRQKLCYDLWRAMAEYWGASRLTPRTFFVVVYLDGAYWGLYTACDHMGNDYLTDMGLPEGGNLYKSVNHDANFYSWNASGSRKSTWHDGYEKKEGLEDDFTDLDDFVEWAASVDQATFLAEDQLWLDPDEFMDWFLFVHYTVSEDSAGKNAYLWNDPSALQWHYSPWDFNHSYGQGWYTYRVASNTYDDFIWNNGIFAHYQEDPEAAGVLWDRMRAMMTDGPMQGSWFLEQVDAYYAAMDLSAARDWNKWSRRYGSYWGSNNRNDYEEEKAYLYQWLEERDGWMWTYHP